VSVSEPSLAERAHAADDTARPAVAVVTGAAVGIGRAITERLLRDGIRVVGLDRDEVAIRGATDELGPGFEAVVGDVSDWAAHERAADAATFREPRTR
jgi:NADP-dependent 3-hydroxy acid dehydrogenase YdfG